MADYDATVEGYDRGRHPGAPRGAVTPQTVRYQLISVDDHLVEPPHMFAGRMPARLDDAAPHVVRGEDGADYWVFEGEHVPLPAADVLQTWHASEWCVSRVNFDEARPGTWNIADRIRDMDAAGVYASLNFPSTVFGFAGQRFLRMKDEALGLASMRAYNRWIEEEWAAYDPRRIIPCQIAWLRDPMVAAAEIRANATRGFKAVAFCENPERLGLPSLYGDYWDPFFAACAETETVVNLHVGSSSQTLVPSSQSPPQVLGALFAVNALQACLDWIYALIPVKHPQLRIALSEGGVGWVPMLLDRLRYQQRVYHPDGLGRHWGTGDRTAEELLRQSFWFTSFYDPLPLVLRDEIGVDRIMFESDYPHADSTWPDTQDVLHSVVRGFRSDEIEKFVYRNAATLYRHPAPVAAA
ncbi:MAG TPA: amidohydrolase family protein [Acidimicrobiales bacterium]|jgi:predicted TIM-barrel fold metal-dependent hydrolase|nr:amidohydrolase family protein [Acidimicrobiales bacterium]